MLQPRCWRSLSSSAIGTAYELHCQRYLTSTLPHLITTLERTGKAGDEGIDLTGALVSTGQPVIIQCKSIKTAVGPATIRELEGTLGHQRHPDPIGILFGAVGFAPATCQRCTTSLLPLILFHLPAPPVEECSDTVRRTVPRLNSILMSRPAQEVFGRFVELQKGLDADGESFVKMQEVLTSR